MKLGINIYVKVGTFATTGSKGIGKVVENRDDKTIIEYFHSISQRVREEVRSNDVKKVILRRHTRCYYFDPNQDQWLMGRINKYNLEERQYEVDFPDKLSTYIDESLLYVRWDRPIDDPIEVMQLKGHETLFYSARRNKFMDSLIEQRRVSRGMTGLMSASVELFPHQVEVIRRVLEDPIPRYLLADEVGLGKTIEAGVILRQYLLDHPKERALVVAPTSLIRQWNQELEYRILSSHFPDRITVIASDELHAHLDIPYGFVIVDEAHEIAHFAESPYYENRNQFYALQRISQRARGLLLLSATPVLNNEREFLAMLVLLDPERYKLTDIESFNNLIEQRQKIGRLLLGFREDSQPFLLEIHTNQLLSDFPNDPFIQEHCKEILLASDPSQRNSLIREVRIHLSETYRIHRRILRNRREVVRDLLKYSRDQDSNLTPVIGEYDLDERSEFLSEILDEWRQFAWASERELWEDDLTTDSALQRLYLLFVELSGSWVELLADAVEYRLLGEPSKILLGSLDEDELKLIRETPLFDGEDELLTRLGNLLRSPSEEGDRVELTKQIIRGIKKTSTLKIVIFTSYTEVCQHLVEVLQNEFGERRVVGYHKGLLGTTSFEQTIEKFRVSPQSNILVCDRLGEAGHNLQFATHVIHFDLPLSPNRVEQRNGRVDRLGRTGPFSFHVLAGGDSEISIHAAWYTFLQKGLKVFQSSIASFQFLLQEKLPQILGSIYVHGVNGLEKWTQDMGVLLEEERIKISEQQVLDEIDVFDHGATSLYADLSEFESRPEEIAHNVIPWIRDTLQFQVQRKMDGRITFNPSFSSLVPVNYLAEIADKLKNPGTFDRNQATSIGGTSIFRIGEPFIDWLSEYISWDDRGKTFAIYRYAPGWDERDGAEWCGLIFNYIVEADISPTQDWVIRHGWKDRVNLPSIQRKLDRFFPPAYKQVIMDEHCNPVTDKKLLDILKRPLQKTEDGGYDTNLTKERLPVLNRFIPTEDWEGLCRTAEQLSAEHLRSDSAFVEECDSKFLQAERDINASLTQLRLRLNDQAELDFETNLYQCVLSGIRSPKLRLDSVGFVVVSGRRFSGGHFHE